MTSPFTGVVLLDKREGESSFSALGALKRRFNTKRVGHTGTLDPMATGLMIALVGPATRCARFFTALDKTYVAEVTFGWETDTDDRTGETVRTAQSPPMKRVDALLNQFIGEISQVPPAYSAIHIDGQRAYNRARAGEEVEIPERSVRIYHIESEVLDDQRLTLTVRCSTGTYVRSLARDIGRAAGSAAHLSALRRIRVGPFAVDEVEPEALLKGIGLGEALLRLDGFRKYEVDSNTASVMWNGGRVPSPGDSAPGDRVLAEFKSLPVAIGRWERGLFHYDLVFPKQVLGND